jgi:hypothetical protein
MKRGLNVELPGLLLHLPSSMTEQSKFWVAVHQCMHKFFKIVVDTQGEDWGTFWETKIDVPKYGQPSIIMSTSNPRDRWEVGVLVRNKGMLAQGEVRWVEILCRCWFRLETNSSISIKVVKAFRESEDKMVFG